jgi:hypothetical protein
MGFESRVTVAFVLAACAGCSGDAREPSDAVAGAGSAGEDVSAIAPARLGVAAHGSGCGALELTALTLRAGGARPELYAALANRGDAPACSPAFSVELYGLNDEFLAPGISGLLVRRFYRVAGLDSIAACVAPGDVTLVVVDLPAELVADDVERIEYWCNFWALDVTPLGGLTIDGVRSVARDSGVAYTGALSNGLDVALGDPSVAVFQVNRAGRPLGVAYASGSLEVPPGGSWEFETNSLIDAGTSQVAYPMHGP